MSERAARPRVLRGVSLAPVLALTMLAVGCAILPPPDPMPEQGSWTVVDGEGISEDLLADDADFTVETVLVVFALQDEFGPENLLDVMWPLEDRAMTAIESAGLGYLDGNEVGDSEYSLYFFGDDREAMWKLLEPIMSTAPYPLARVELWPPGREAEPLVIPFGDE